MPTGVLQRRRGSRADPVTEDDVLRAMAKLKVLGGGFDVVTVSLFPFHPSINALPRAELSEDLESVTMWPGGAHLLPFSLSSVCGAPPGGRAAAGALGARRAE